jgi:hypothetical protein
MVLWKVSLSRFPWNPAKVLTKKSGLGIAPEASPPLLSPMSVLQHITDSSQPSRLVRKVPTGLLHRGKLKPPDIASVDIVLTLIAGLYTQL